MTSFPQYCRAVTPRLCKRLSFIPPHHHHTKPFLSTSLSLPFTTSTNDSVRIKTNNVLHRQSSTSTTPTLDQNFDNSTPTITQTYTPLTDILRKQIQDGTLVSDVAQGRAARRLSRLQKALVGYDNKGAITEVEEIIRRKKMEMRAKAAEAAAADGGNDGGGKKMSRVMDSESRRGDYRYGNIMSGGTISEMTKKLQPDNNSTTRTTTIPSKTKSVEDMMSITTSRVPRGLFLHGDVGTGKSFLMDTFYSNAPVPIAKKRRVHFHSFMQDVHRRVHETKRQDLDKDGRSFTVDTNIERNPIYRVATNLASEVTLLCFDEFQVIDIADALILSQLFKVLFERGTVVVATSNRPPSSLYEGGLNRSYFMPFIGLLERHCIVHDMEAKLDYRRISVDDGQGDFFFVNQSSHPLCPTYEATFHATFPDVTFHETTLPIAFQRTLHIQQSSPSMARFHFDDLCTSHNLGFPNYRAIANQYPVVVLEGIPRLP